MVREVQIFMKNTQCVQGEEDVIEMAAYGEAGSIGNARYLKYEELSEEGESIQTVIKFTGQTVEVIKRGALRSKMVFTEDAMQETEYETPYGIFLMTMDTREVRFEETEEGINILLTYFIYMNEEIISENKMQIAAIWKN